MSIRKIAARMVALESAIDVAIDMAQELIEMADDIDKTCGANEADYLRQLVARWESAYAAIDREDSE